MKILILKPSSLGDVVQAIPVLRLLKRHHPESRIHWWIDSHLAPLLEVDPDLDGLILFDRRRWASPKHWGEAYRSLATIRQHRFDLVLDLQALARSGVVAWLAGAGRVVGLDDRREGAPAWHDVSIARRGWATHAVDWYLDAVRALGVPVRWDFDWLPARPDVRAGIRARWSVEGWRWVLLQPGARWDNKRWPAEHFGELVRTLSATGGPDLRFGVLGSPSERPLADRICAVAPDRCENLAGQTSLPEMVEWLRSASLLVTNDSGPMHVAAALGRPVIGLFGPTEPSRTGPYGQLREVLRFPLPCAPCLKDRCAFERPMECLRAISPALVSQRVLARIEAARTSGEGGREASKRDWVLPDPQPELE